MSWLLCLEDIVCSRLLLLTLAAEGRPILQPDVEPELKFSGDRELFQVVSLFSSWDDFKLLPRDSHLDSCDSQHFRALFLKRMNNYKRDKRCDSHPSLLRCSFGLFCFAR